MSYKKPLPQISSDTRAFWEGCRRHVFRIQKCANCGQIRWPSSFLCPHCLSDETKWIEASGRGVVYSYVVYHVAYDPSFEDDLPYVVALVEMDEGFRFLTNIVECNPEEVHCGMAVETLWDDVTETISLPKFRPS